MSSRSKLLIVDDQEINVLILRTIFEQEFDVVAARDGAQALQLAQSTLPDLILLDILMPGLGGIDVCRQLKDNPCTRDIPVIFVTSQDHPEEETIGLEAGAVDFISKPVNTAVVRARVRTQLTLKHQSDLLKTQATTDALTGISNRRRFDEVLEFEWGRAVRNRSSLALLMMDVDNFKNFNDTFGHPAGDTYLKTVSMVMKDELKRSQDILARYGGEEFACLLPDTAFAEAEALAQRIVQQVFLTPFFLPGNEEPIFGSISLGFAVTTPSPVRGPFSILSAADTQLYQAKGAGKNRAQGIKLGREIRTASSLRVAGSSHQWEPILVQKSS